MHWALLPSIIASLLALYSRRSIEPNPNLDFSNADGASGLRI
jgi:hypothetical protein